MQLFGKSNIPVLFLSIVYTNRAPDWGSPGIGSVSVYLSSLL